MILFTADKYGRPGHPTKKSDMIRKQRKRGRVKIIGGGASGKSPVVMFLDREFDYSKTVPRKIIIALDPGYSCIGFAVCEPKDKKTDCILPWHFKNQDSGNQGVDDRKKEVPKEQKILFAVQKKTFIRQTV